MTMQITRGPDPRFFDGRGSGCSLFERPAAKPELLEAFRMGQRASGVQLDFRPIDAARRATGFPVWKDTLEACVAATERAFDVPAEALLQPGRTQKVAQARFALMWLLRTVASWSYPLIADRLGMLDHTTIVHGVKRAWQLRGSDVRYLLLTDAMVRAVLAPLESEVRAASSTSDPEGGHHAG